MKDVDIKIAEEFERIFMVKYEVKQPILDLIKTIKYVKDFERELPKLNLLDQARFITKLFSFLYDNDKCESKVAEDIIHSDVFFNWMKDNEGYILYSSKKEINNEKETSN